MLDQLPQDVLVHEVLVHFKGWDIFSVSTVNKDLFETLQDSRTVKYLKRECVQYKQPHGRVRNTNRTVTWYKEGLKHRDGDLPAVVWYSGRREWYKNGLLHRDGDLPAIVWSDGSQQWYKEGKIHRDGDLPAIVLSNGDQVWFKDGEQHRDGDLPAAIYDNGHQVWYKEGVFIRDE